MKKLFWKGLKAGICANILSILFMYAYVLIVENWLVKPVNTFVLPLELGTIVDSRRLFQEDVPSMKLKKSWLAIQSKFSFFVVEYQLRSDFKQQSPRLLRWCRNSNCFAHRLDYGDRRRNQFNSFTIDDWFANNFMIPRDAAIDIQRLNLFLKTLPPGATVILSEPFSIFDRPQVFQKFSEWVLQLRADNPHLKFEIGLQVHLQWADAFWFKNWWVLDKLSKFSKIHGYPWGVSEFSNYDRIWKRRIRGRSSSDRIFYKIEGFIPRRLRRAVVLHGTYLIHRESVKYGAVRPGLSSGAISSKLLGLSAKLMLPTIPTTSCSIVLVFLLLCGGQRCAVYPMVASLIS
jgi:hypothetical protein